MVALHWNEAAVEFGSPLGDWAALFRIALPTSWHEEGARKGALKKNSLLHTTLASKPRLGGDPTLAVERKQRRKSTWLLH